MGYLKLYIWNSPGIQVCGIFYNIYILSSCLRDKNSNILLITGISILYLNVTSINMLWFILTVNIQEIYRLFISFAQGNKKTVAVIFMSQIIQTEILYIWANVDDYFRKRFTFVMCCLRHSNFRFRFTEMKSLLAQFQPKNEWKRIDVRFKIR